MTSILPATASKGCGCLIATLLVVGGSTYNPVMAAETAIQVTVAALGNLQRPEPETAPGGTVVLRGSPATPIANSPATETSGRSGYYQSTFPYTQYYGVDNRFNGNFNTSGFDRNFNTSGFNRNFDRNGLR